MFVDKRKVLGRGESVCRSNFFSSILYFEERKCSHYQFCSSFPLFSLFLLFHFLSSSSSSSSSFSSSSSSSSSLSPSLVTSYYQAATAVKISMATQYPHQSDPLFRISAKVRIIEQLLYLLEEKFEDTLIHSFYQR